MAPADPHLLKTDLNYQDIVDFAHHKSLVSHYWWNKTAYIKIKHWRLTGVGVSLIGKAPVVCAWLRGWLVTVPSLFTLPHPAVLPCSPRILEVRRLSCQSYLTVHCVFVTHATRDLNTGITTDTVPARWWIQDMYRTRIEPYKNQPGIISDRIEPYSPAWNQFRQDRTLQTS